MAKKTNRNAPSGTRRSARLPWVLGSLGVAALLVIPILVNIVQAANLPGERFPSQGNRHVPLDAAVPAYNSDPPTSGPHTANLAPWGSYLPGEAPPERSLIHNMEDGGVIIWYLPAASEGETLQRVTALEQLAARYRRVVIVPREGMETSYALTAWQRLQRFDQLDPEGMLAFLEAYEGIDHHVP